MTTPETLTHGPEGDVWGITPPSNQRRSTRPLTEVMIDLELVSQRRVELAVE